MAKKKKKDKITELKKIKVLSLSKIGGLFGVIYGLVIALLLVLVNSLSGVQQTAELNVMGQFGGLSIIIFPLIYGILYFISAAITALIYNLLASWVGGIELNLK